MHFHLLPSLLVFKAREKVQGNTHLKDLNLCSILKTKMKLRTCARFFEGVRTQSTMMKKKGRAQRWEGSGYMKIMIDLINAFE